MIGELLSAGPLYSLDNVVIVFFLIFVDTL
jgi:hypothetical protein